MPWLADDWCLCRDGGRCHFHSFVRVDCIGCRFATVLVPVDRPPLFAMYRVCSAVKR